MEGDTDTGAGNATPVPVAPPVTSDIAIGETKKIDEGITDAVPVGDRAAPKVGDKVSADPLNNPTEHSMRPDAKCGELAPGSPNALPPYEDGIHVTTDQAMETAIVGRGINYSVAVDLEGDHIIGTHADSNAIDVSGADSKLASNFRTASNGSQSVKILKANNDADVKLLEVSHLRTSVRELKFDEPRAGSVLRTGIGAGRVASGGHAIVATNIKGNQLLIYTATDTIRLYQVVPAPEVSWVVTVDKSHGIVWVAPTKVNKLTGYGIDSGTSVKVADVNTIADPQSAVAIEGGQTGIFSATGDGAQIFDSVDVDKITADSRQDAEKIREGILVREPADKLLTGVDDTKGADDPKGETKQTSSKPRARSYRLVLKAMFQVPPEQIHEVISKTLKGLQKSESPQRAISKLLVADDAAL